MVIDLTIGLLRSVGMRLRTKPGDLAHPLLSALEADYDCVCLVENGVESQTDETMKPPLSGFVRAGGSQDLD